MSERQTPAPAPDPGTPAGGSGDATRQPSAGEGGTGAGAAPGVADGREHRLELRSVTVGRMVGGIAFAFWLGASAVGFTVAAFALPGGLLAHPLLLVVWAMVTLALAALSWAWPSLRYRHIAYRVEPWGMTIRRGVVWRSEIHVPRSRLQHTDVSQGPLDRLFDLATLILHTAGTQDASVALGGVAHGRALEIRDYLLEGDGHDHDDAV